MANPLERNLRNVKPNWGEELIPGVIKFDV